MESLLDFMYCGEAYVKQEELENFLKAGDELGVRGLSSTSTVSAATLTNHDSNQNILCSVHNTNDCTEPTNSSLTPSSPHTSKNVSANIEASKMESVMFGDSETTVKSEEGSEVYANTKETVMVKKWEDLKKYVISTSMKDTSGKIVRIHQCTMQLSPCKGVN